MIGVLVRISMVVVVLWVLVQMAVPAWALFFIISLILCYELLRVDLLGGRVVTQINRLVTHRHRVIVTIATRCEIRLVALAVWSGCGRVVRRACILVDEDEVVNDVFKVDCMPLALPLVHVVVKR